jgi:hypothetical protein
MSPFASNPSVNEIGAELPIAHSRKNSEPLVQGERLASLIPEPSTWDVAARFVSHVNSENMPKFVAVQSRIPRVTAPNQMNDLLLSLSLIGRRKNALSVDSDRAGDPVRAWPELSRSASGCAAIDKVFSDLVLQRVQLAEFWPNDE